jgi:hypothetical protein
MADTSLATPATPPCLQCGNPTASSADTTCRDCKPVVARVQEQTGAPVMPRRRNGAT